MRNRKQIPFIGRKLSRSAVLELTGIPVMHWTGQRTSRQIISPFIIYIKKFLAVRLIQNSAILCYHILVGKNMHWGKTNIPSGKHTLAPAKNRLVSHVNRPWAPNKDHTCVLLTYFLNKGSETSIATAKLKLRGLFLAILTNLCKVPFPTRQNSITPNREQTLGVSRKNSLSHTTNTIMMSWSLDDSILKWRRNRLLSGTLSGKFSEWTWTWTLFLSDEGATLETLDFAFRLWAVYQTFIFRFLSLHCLHSTLSVLFHCLELQYPILPVSYSMTHRDCRRVGSTQQ